ncbi:MAG: hypothetical protein HYZ21_00640 [Chloroflexi bacterium]|nr:hypothetical protein [Chloroflexota bacterium]
MDNIAEGSKINQKTTRCLAAAAYSNPFFRTHAIRTVLENELKAVGPSVGIDLETVLRHCLDARAAKRRRDWIPIIIGFLGAPLSFFENYDAIFFLHFLGIVICLYVFIRDSWWCDITMASRNLSKHSYNPDRTRPLSSRDAKRVAQAQAYSTGNVVTYSGFSPFVGSGIDMGGWSFSLDLTKKKAHTALESPLDFRIDELYDALDKSVASLDLDHLSFREQLYINGQDVGDSPEQLPNRLGAPLPSVPDSKFKELRESGGDNLYRFYKSYSVTDWGGDLVFTLFLRIRKRRDNLFVESDYFLLTPLQQIYTSVDSLPKNPTFTQMCRVVGKGILFAIVYTLLWPLVLLIKGILFLNRYQNRKKAKTNAKQRGDYDYGAVQTLREFAASPGYHRYFQKLDTSMYQKLLELKVLDCVVGFLDERGIETTDIRERQSTILNHGVVVSGGEVKVGSMSFGQQAMATARGYSTGGKPAGNQT